MRLPKSLYTTLLLVPTTLASLTIIDPTAGSTLTAGGTCTVKWAPSTNPDNFTLSIVLKRGDPLDTSTQSIVQIIAAGGVPNTGAFHWNVDGNLTEGNNYYVRVQTGLETDWVGSLTPDPPQAGGVYGLSGLFNIASNATSSNSTSATGSASVLSNTASSSSGLTVPSNSPPPLSTTTLSSGPSSTSGVKSIFIKNDDPAIVYLPPDAWSTAATTASCQSSSIRYTTTIDASISYNFTGSAIYVNTLSSQIGGLFSVTIGNQTQVFDSFSPSNALSCGTLSSIRTPASLIAHVLADSENPQTIIIKHIGPSPDAPTITSSEIQFGGFNVTTGLISQTGASVGLDPHTPFVLTFGLAAFCLFILTYSGI